MMPKQFLEIFGSSLFQRTLQRALIFSKPGEIFVVTNKEYRFRVMDDLEEIGIKLKQKVLEL
jgi:mannose-1-phosphate guanylyltransferase/mannose-6-phosphate isomerase